MDKRMLSLLTDAERLLVAETDKAALAGLDEDELVDLHTRVRRARGKYVGQYRRAASARVGAVGGRGKAHGQNQRARDKAEAFEVALGRVSTALAAAARASAAALKAERLAAARAGGSGPARATRPVGGTSPARGRTAAAPTTPVTRKKNASTLAAGARRQAERDTR